MARGLRRRSKKAGLPPGTPVYIGEQKTEKSKFVVIHFDAEHYQEKAVDSVCEALAITGEGLMRWIHIDGIDHVENLTELGGALSWHPLVIEDIMNADQRPKMEDYDSYLYVVWKTLSLPDPASEVGTEQISVLLSPNLVVSFQESPGNVAQIIRERLKAGKGRVRRMGADYLAYTLLDSSVDYYFSVLEKLGEKIEFLEEELTAHPTQKTLKNIYAMKREMIYLRKSVWPLREVISGLQRGDSELVGEATRTFLRDVYDHTIQVIDAIETYRDILSGMLEIYLSSINNRMNEVIKVLTIMSTLFMPLTFLVGVYGMNFHHMPELSWRWGYLGLWLVMMAVVGGMLTYFRKKKWI